MGEFPGWAATLLVVASAHFLGTTLGALTPGTRRRRIKARLVQAVVGVNLLGSAAGVIIGSISMESLHDLEPLKTVNVALTLLAGTVAAQGLLLHAPIMALLGWVNERDRHMIDAIRDLLTHMAFEETKQEHRTRLREVTEQGASMLRDYGIRSVLDGFLDKADSMSRPPKEQAVFLIDRVDAIANRELADREAFPLFSDILALSGLAFVVSLLAGLSSST